MSPRILAALRPMLVGAWMASFAASAGATSVTGTIAQLAINKLQGNFVFVKMSSPPSPALACSTNGSWDYVFTMTTDLDKKIYASLLTAKSTGTTVMIVGTAACGDYGTIESGAEVVQY